MSAPRTKAPGKPGPRPSRSGPNIPDAQRGTVKLQLRVQPDVAALARRLADERGLTLSQCVSDAIVTLERVPME